MLRYSDVTASAARAARAGADSSARFVGRHRCVVAVAAALVLYLVLLFRYYYRAHDATSVIQCTVADFSRRMLDDRQPIVCTDAGSIAAVKRARRSDASMDVYDHVDIGRWYHRRDPLLWCGDALPGVDDSSVATGPVQSWYDVIMIVQKRGTRRVRVYPPPVVRASSTVPVIPNTLLYAGDGDGDGDYTEIILREQSALILPIRWWFSLTAAEGDTPPTSLVMAWRNPVGRIVHPIARRAYASKKARLIKSLKLNI